jgi:hypothetical protein
MHDIGWLFLFMSDFEDKSVLTTLRCQPDSSGQSAECVEPVASLTVEQTVALREFFELIARWDEEK